MEEGGAIILETSKEKVMKIEGSMREKYILAQALTLAIRALEEVEPPVMREISNIADMKAMLRSNLLDPFSEMFYDELEEEGSKV